jgi:thymidylate synthase (FAD)
MKIAPIEVTIINHCGDDLSVVNAARVSFEKQTKGEAYYACKADEEDGYYSYRLSEGDKKLISYLAKHKHFSPFNHAFLSFRVKAPIFVARQLVKHKFMPWNEVSRRYVDSEPEFYLPGEGRWRGKADNVKQGSAEEGFTYDTTKYEDLWGDHDNGGDPDLHYHHATYNALATYKYAISQGMCPEMARMILPLNTMTEWIWSGTLGAFADMLKLRLDPHAQKESRDVAELIYAQALPLFPVSLPALLENK